MKRSTKWLVAVVAGTALLALPVHAEEEGNLRIIAFGAHPGVW